MCTEELWPLPCRFVPIWLTIKCQSSSRDDTSHCRQDSKVGRQGRDWGSTWVTPAKHPSAGKAWGGLNTHLRVSSHLANSDLQNTGANHKNWLPQWQKKTVLLVPKSLPCTHEDRYLIFTSIVPAVGKNPNTLITAVQEHAQVCTHLSLSHKEIKKKYLSANF